MNASNETKGGAPRGRLIAIEGPDGAGKTTQVRRLAERLRGEGVDVLTTREPGGTALGERIRDLLLDPASGEIDVRTELFLFMASRARLCEEVVGPAVAAGRTVILDRYLLSSVVYQGVAGGLDVGRVIEAGLLATGDLLPDVTFILDLPADVGLARRKGGKDRMEARAIAYHRRVREGFLSAATRVGGAIHVVDAMLPEDEVHRAIWGPLRDGA